MSQLSGVISDAQEIGDKFDEVGDRLGEVGDKIGNAIDKDALQGAVGGVIDDLEGTVSQVGDKLNDGISLAEQRFNIAPGLIPLGLVVLAVILFLRPLKWFIKVALNSVLGIVGLVLLAQFGGALGVVIELSTANVLIAAVLGVPGVAVLFAIQWLALL